MTKTHSRKWLWQRDQTEKGIVKSEFEEMKRIKKISKWQVHKQVIMSFR